MSISLRTLASLGGLTLAMTLSGCLTPPAQTGALGTGPKPVAEPAVAPVRLPQAPQTPAALYPGDTLEDDDTLVNLIFEVVETPFKVAYPIVTDTERTAACIRVHGRPKGGGVEATRWVIIQQGQVELVPLQRDTWKVSADAERTVRLLCAKP